MFIYGESSPKFQMYNEQKTNGALTKDKSKCHNWNAEKVYRFEILIHNQREEEIEKSCEEEREGFPIPIFPCPSPHPNASELREC